MIKSIFKVFVYSVLTVVFSVITYMTIENIRMVAYQDGFKSGAKRAVSVEIDRYKTVARNDIETEMRSKCRYWFDGTRQPASDNALAFCTNLSFMEPDGLSK